MTQSKGLIFILIVCAFVFGLSGHAFAVKNLWQVALEEIEGSMQHEYAKKFVEIIASQSKGEIRCNIHFYGALGTSN